MLQNDDLEGLQATTGRSSWSSFQHWWKSSMLYPRVLAAGTDRDSVRENASNQATLSISFLIMNILATIVASYGLLANSTAVVIGAMVIATLLGPIMGIALGLLESHALLLRRALVTEVVGMITVLCVALLIGWLYRDIPAGSELLSRTSPTTFDLMIALAGGAAGAYAMVSPRLSVGLVGVAVATALVPPLSTCGILLARGDIAQAGGAFFLFVTNLVAIQCASSVVFLLAGYAHLTQHPTEWRTVLLRNGVSVVLLLILVGILGVNLKQVVDRTLYETTIRSQLTTALQNYPGAFLADVRFDDTGKGTLVTAVVRTPVAFTPRQVASLQAHLSPPTSGSLDLHVRSVITVETTTQGTAVPALPASP